MSKELKIGIISLLTLTIAIWGYQYLKGKNLLKKGYSFSAVYDNVEGLAKASPIEINGLKIGSVSDIGLNPENLQSMIVYFDIQGEFMLPSDTKAILASDNGIVGSKKIILSFDRQCNGADCLEGGERLQSGSRGFLDAIVGQDELKEFFGSLRKESGPIIDTLLYRLSDQNSDNSVTQSLIKMEESMRNLASITESMDKILKKSYTNLNETVENLAVVTGSFAKSHEDIEHLLNNLSTFSDQIVSADVGTTLSKTGETLDNSKKLIQDLQQSVSKANETFESLNTLLLKAESGEGAIGQLLNNPEMYNNLEEASKHMSLLLQDLRLNPKRYVRLSVFGRKGNAYTYPKEDPAYIDSIQQN